MRVKIRNPNLKDLPDFLATLSKEDKLEMLKMMEEEFARQHYYLSKYIPESYRGKGGKANLVQLAYDQLKGMDTPSSTLDSRRLLTKASLDNKVLKVELPAKKLTEPLISYGYAEQRATL